MARDHYHLSYREIPDGPLCSASVWVLTDVVALMGHLRTAGAQDITWKRCGLLHGPGVGLTPEQLAPGAARGPVEA